jgi:hypothetical protein
MFRKLITSVQEKGILYTLKNGPDYLFARGQELLWPVAHYPARKLLNHDEDRFWTAFSKNCICVLGRGPSLKNVHELEFIDTFIIINHFELGDKTVRDALKSKDILHFTGRPECTLSPHNYYLFNFIGYQLSTREGVNVEGENGFGGERHLCANVKRSPEFYGINPREIPEAVVSIIMKEFNGVIHTSGILAVLYAAEVSDANHVYTAGIDFYESGSNGYLYSDDIPDDFPESQSWRSSDLKRDMSTIARLYPKTHFHIVTQSTYEPNIQNVHIHSRGIKSKTEDY